MAKRGSNKRKSTDQEAYVARLYRGDVSPSSGGAVSDAGDVRVKARGLLIECKVTGTPGVPPKSKPRIIKEFEKITEEAWAEGRDPVLCLRYYEPSSILSNRDGWVDLTIRRTTDDAERPDANQVS